MTSRLDVRITAAQRERLEAVARELELGEAEILRAFLDGYASINTVHLTRTFRAMRESGRTRKKDIVTVLPTDAIENAIEKEPAR